MFKLTKRMAIVSASAIVAIAGAGIAYAAWLATGSGNTTTTAATLSPLKVTVAIADSPKLVPSVVVPASITISNADNPGVPAKVDTISLGSVTVDDAHKALCPADSLHVTMPTERPAITPGGSVTVAGGSVMLDGAASPGCMGARFTVSVDASAVVGQ